MTHILSLKSHDSQLGFKCLKELSPNKHGYYLLWVYKHAAYELHMVIYDHNNHIWLYPNQGHGGSQEYCV